MFLSFQRAQSTSVKLASVRLSYYLIMYQIAATCKSNLQVGSLSDISLIPSSSVCDITGLMC